MATREYGRATLRDHAPEDVEAQVAVKLPQEGQLVQQDRPEVRPPWLDPQLHRLAARHLAAPERHRREHAGQKDEE